MRPEDRQGRGSIMSIAVPARIRHAGLRPAVAVRDEEDYPKVNMLDSDRADPLHHAALQ
jgi:hypothetical protein